MTRPALLAAALLAIALVDAAPSSAAADVSLPRFEAVALHGGGTVTLRHGPQQKVTITRGDAAISSFGVDRRSLEIRACDQRCPQGYRLEVEIVSPDIRALAVRGGGTMTMAGFPAQGQLALSVQGGGNLDTRGVQARQVAASVQGGGAIRTWATGSLAASIRGGGGIVYRGEPTLATSVQGGGSVRAE
jgi:hypothetical protein